MKEVHKKDQPEVSGGAVSGTGLRNLPTNPGYPIQPGYPTEPCIPLPDGPLTYDEK